MNLRPLALSLDLDDTLWPIWPSIERAERALDAFLREHCPRTANRFPVHRMRRLREEGAISDGMTWHGSRSVACRQVVPASMVNSASRGATTAHC